MPSHRTPYSSKIILRLTLAGQVLALSQVGPDFMILRNVPEESELSGTGRIDIIVDDRVATSQSIFLPHGITSGEKHIVYF